MCVCVCSCNSTSSSSEKLVYFHPLMYFRLQMIELYKNPSGDVQLSTQPKSEPQNNYLTQPTGSSEDNAKIAQLRETIHSLQTELDAVSCSYISSGLTGLSLLEVAWNEFHEICWNVHEITSLGLSILHSTFKLILAAGSRRIVDV